MLTIIIVLIVLFVLFMAAATVTNGITLVTSGIPTASVADQNVQTGATTYDNDVSTSTSGGANTMTWAAPVQTPEQTTMQKQLCWCLGGFAVSFSAAPSAPVLVTVTDSITGLIVFAEYVNQVSNQFDFAVAKKFAQGAGFTINVPSVTSTISVIAIKSKWTMVG